MAKTFYRILKETIKDPDGKVLNKKGERVLTSGITEADYWGNGKIIPIVRVLELHWYHVPLSCFKLGIVEEFTK